MMVAYEVMPAVKRQEDAIPSSVPQTLLASTGFLLARLGSESHKRFARGLAQHGLRPSHYGVLMALAEIGMTSQQRLAAIIAVDPRNAVGIIDLLEERGLVERGIDPTDRRRHGITLTTTGRALLGQLRLESDELERAMLADLDAAERAQLHDLLLKLLSPATKHSPL